MRPTRAHHRATAEDTGAPHPLNDPGTPQEQLSAQVGPYVNSTPGLDYSYQDLVVNQHHYTITSPLDVLNPGKVEFQIPPLISAIGRSLGGIFSGGPIFPNAPILSGVISDIAGGVGGFVSGAVGGIGEVASGMLQTGGAFISDVTTREGHAKVAFTFRQGPRSPINP